MKTLSAFATVFILTITGFMTLSLIKPEIRAQINTPKINKDPKIQAAILLDVSGSMGGLIEQAKAQLWNMVSVMGKAKCENGIPKIEIALYEYGRSINDAKAGFIKQISGFTSDLDQLSQELFQLTINGSEEYCGQVIFTSLNELSWDTSSSNYKVIFIAGNEDFLQGSIHYTKACNEANRKGVIVNTIYCGDKLQGIKEHWNLAGECGQGSYTNINQDAKQEDIPTPYDSTLFLLNDKLNGTYLVYGVSGYFNFSTQAKVDQMNLSQGKRGAAKRVAVKANKQLYNNSTWDLLDANAADSSFLTKVDRKTLPDSLQNKSREELQQLVDAKTAERGLIQKDILIVNTQRENYIAAEKAKVVNNNKETTLETEIEKIIKEQVKRFKMIIQ
jgi:hypothetical protein